MQQGSPEWKAARLGKATSSRFGDVMSSGKAGKPSKSAEAYMLELISEILTGRAADEINAKPIKWGNQNEGQARASYVWHTGTPVSQTGFVQHPTIKRCGGSPDSLVGHDGLLEIKCPYSSKVHIDTLVKQMVPLEHDAQIQGNLWITDRQWCDFVSFDPRMPEGLDRVIIRVERDPGFIAEIEDRVLRFIDHLERKLAKVLAYGEQVKS